MSPTKLRASGIQGVGLVAVTYVYFLIFAQFAFIHRLDTLGITGTHLKSVMAAMAIGGIVLSLVAPRLGQFPSPARRLQCAFGGAAIAAFLTLAPLNLASAVAVSMLIGAGLGLLTVTLVTHLRQWIGNRNALLKVGLGTGIGYFLCNVPLLFTATPEIQSATAGLLCLIGIVLANFTVGPSSEPEARVRDSASLTIPFPLVVASFAALVWLDSAAFFIIQNTSALKAGTWQGSAHLWANALIHLCAALFSAWLLRRRELPFVLACIAVGALAFACLLLLDPARAITASVFYPIGVSLYSVAAGRISIASFTSRFQRATRSPRRLDLRDCRLDRLSTRHRHGPESRSRPAGLRRSRHRSRTCASDLQDLPRPPSRTRPHHRRTRHRSGRLPHPARSPVAASSTAIERGRLVYISEGCIHCHSQYVRPGHRRRPHVGSR